MDEPVEIAQDEGNEPEECENPYGDIRCECGNSVHFQHGTRSDVVCRWNRYMRDGKQGCGKVLIPGSIQRSPDGEILLCPKCDARVFKPFNSSRWPFGRIVCACGHVLRSKRSEDKLPHPDNDVEDGGTNTPPPRELDSGEE